ncbi:hypothetical protein CELL_02597 [Cellulomonas sp. T2.31MG-18]|uniref:hypothetical protein n=1 Tax=Cellulomonas sp. T2.31MG-18 TaxID=3157619 RepID=UPI0035EA34DA
MAGAKKGTWIGATVVGAVAIVVASWFLAINPALGAAADVRAQTVQTKQANDALALKVAKLRADFAKLADYKKQLAAIQVQVPTTAQLSDYLRQLDTIAAARSVTITAVAPGTPQAVVAKAAVAPVAPPTTASATAGPTPAATPAATPVAAPATGTGNAAAAAASAVPDGFSSIPLSVTVIGSYDNTLAFLSDLQTATPRLYLVSGFTATGQQDAAAAGGKPKTVVGDQQLVITGFLYALPDTTAVPAPSASATPALPSAVGGKNPLVPVGGK